LRTLSPQVKRPSPHTGRQTVGPTGSRHRFWGPYSHAQAPALAQQITAAAYVLTRLVTIRASSRCHDAPSADDAASLAP